MIRNVVAVLAIGLAVTLGTPTLFSVQEAEAPALADLRPGETVRITYVSVDGTLRTLRMVKAPEVAPKQ